MLCIYRLFSLSLLKGLFSFYGCGCPFSIYSHTSFNSIFLIPCFNRIGSGCFIRIWYWSNLTWHLYACKKCLDIKEVCTCIFC